MELRDIITILTNKITSLQASIDYAYNVGNLDLYTQLQQDLQQTQITLDQLKSI